MKDKIIRSMFHGSLKTKVYLWSILLLGLVAFGMLVTAIALGMSQLAMGGVVIGMLCFISTQSVSVNALQKADEKATKQKQEATYEVGTLSPKERERAKARYLSSLGEKQVKKLMRQHHVTASHQKIMIDVFAKRKLTQVPAFAWRTGEALHFLVLEGHANEFSIPLREIQGIYMEKNVEADAENEYAFFRFSNYISKLFAPYLPTYSQANRDGNLVYQKNLFYIKPGLYVTNTSMANLMELLPRVPFLLDDEVCRAARFDEYFKEIYRSGILCKAQVISLEQYKEGIARSLEELLQAPMSSKAFIESLKNMVRYHLITQEQAVEYTRKYQEMHKK